MSSSIRARSRPLRGVLVIGTALWLLAVLGSRAAPPGPGPGPGPASAT